MLGKGAVLSFVALVVGCGSADVFRGNARPGGSGASDSGLPAGGRGAGGNGGSVVLCASDKTCTPLRKLCDVGLGFCVDCLRDSDCTGGTCRGGICQARVTCNNSLDCASAPDGRVICDGATGDCVQCVTNVDCDPGKACRSHLCTGTGTGGGPGRGGTAGAGGALGVGGTFDMGGTFNAGGFVGIAGFAPGGAPSTGGLAGDGGSGGRAAAGTPCTKATDCQSWVCAGGSCQPPTCDDGTANGGETTSDCGGPCPQCRVGGVCSSSANCASGNCSTGTGGTTGTCAAAATCSDGFQNGSESDTDCGGLACAKCTAGKRCRSPGDCNTRICSAGVCGTCNPDMCLPGAFGSPCCTTAGACSTLGILFTCI
jgi:hypothetical protein